MPLTPAEHRGHGLSKERQQARAEKTASLCQAPIAPPVETADPTCAQVVDGRVKPGHDEFGEQLMPEVAQAGEHHGEARRVGGGDHLVVAHRAAGLDDRRRARLRHHIEPVGEGKERV